MSCFNNTNEEAGTPTEQSDIIFAIILYVVLIQSYDTDNTKISHSC